MSGLQLPKVECWTPYVHASRLLDRLESHPLCQGLSFEEYPYGFWHFSVTGIQGMTVEELKQALQVANLECGGNGKGALTFTDKTHQSDTSHDSTPDLPVS